MDNQNIFVEEGRQTGQDAQSTHKLHKRERRLLEKLSEAQEAEARANERFQRAQAKLERRKARIQRLEQSLTQLREELTSLPDDAVEHYTHQDEHAANGYERLDTPAQDTLLAPSEDTPVPSEAAIEPPAAPEVEEDTLEAEVHMTPDLLPTPTATSILSRDDSVEPALSGSEPPEEVLNGTPAIHDTSGEARQEESSEEAEWNEEAPQQAQPQKSPEQVLMEAREVWQMADASYQLARNRAQDLASSISILIQSNLSSTVMDELLRKQSEANKAQAEAQRIARIAYEELVQAEEAYRGAQSL